MKSFYKSLVLIAASFLSLGFGVNSTASTIGRPFNITIDWSGDTVQSVFGGFRQGSSYWFNFSIEPTVYQNEIYFQKCDLYFSILTPLGQWLSWVEPEDKNSENLLIKNGIHPLLYNTEINFQSKTSSDQIFGKRAPLIIPDDEKYQGIFLILSTCVMPGKDPLNTDYWYQSAIKAFTVRPKFYKFNQ